MDDAPQGSIAELASHRGDLLVFEIRAKIAEEDMEWMARRVEAAFAGRDVIDMLLILSGYDGAEIGGVVNAEVLTVQVRSAAHVRRYAVVGAPLWAKAMITVFSPLMPVEARTFDLDEIDAARDWVDAPSTS